jgi:FtsH-binding integral membrane protein
MGDFNSQAGVREGAVSTIMRNVYLWMALGLIITAVSGFVFVNVFPQVIMMIWSSNITILVYIAAKMLLVGYLASQIQKLSVMTATLLFAAYAALMGLTFAVFLVVFTSASILAVFFMAAGMFAVVSAVGFFTKHDFASIKNYLFMGLAGIAIASLVNLFMRSDMMSYIISYVGVVLFLALTIYDTQKLKKFAMAQGPSLTEESYAKMSIYFALELYMDFINLFFFLLRIFGRRR